MFTYLRDTDLKIAEVKRTETPRSGHTKSGYGPRVPTSRMIRLENDHKWRRIYCVIYSNAGTAFFVHDKRRVVVSDCDLPEETKDA